MWGQGLSVCTTIIAGETYLVAFGGYNGKYQNEVNFANKILSVSDADCSHYKWAISKHMW